MILSPLVGKITRLSPLVGKTTILSPLVWKTIILSPLVGKTTILSPLVDKTTIMSPLVGTMVHNVNSKEFVKEVRLIKLKPDKEMYSYDSQGTGADNRYWSRMIL